MTKSSILNQALNVHRMLNKVSENISKDSEDNIVFDLNLHLEMLQSASDKLSELINELAVLEETKSPDKTCNCCYKIERP